MAYTSVDERQRSRLSPDFTTDGSAASINVYLFVRHVQTFGQSETPASAQAELLQNSAARLNDRKASNITPAAIAIRALRWA
ncbi:hypothetical protein [Bradyrhizobium sp. USDA 4506]